MDIYLLGIKEKNKEEFEEMSIKIWATISDLKDEIRKL